jgi:hypothetical protein
VNLAPAGGLPRRAPLCSAHWQHVDQGGEWFAEEKPGDPRTPRIQVVTGDELAKRRLTVADGASLTWHRGGFSPHLDPRRNFGILRIEGRVYGSDDERVHVDLTLTPEALRQLRSVLKLYSDAGPRLMTKPRCPGDTAASLRRRVPDHSVPPRCGCMDAAGEADSGTSGTISGCVAPSSATSRGVSSIANHS